MLTLHPEYIIGATGEKMVALPLKEFDQVMEELEDIEDVRLYEAAKKEDTGERITLSDYLKQRKPNNG